MNSCGLFFFYWGEIQLCKIKAAEFSDNDYIPQKSLTVFSSDTKVFELVNKNEILADGKLYDIVKKEMRNGKALYFTLGDEQEDRYVQNLIEWGINNSRERSLPGKIINLHIAKYFTVEKYYSFVSSSLHLSNYVKASSDFFFYIWPFINIFSPPPDNFLS